MHKRKIVIGENAVAKSQEKVKGITALNLTAIVLDNSLPAAAPAAGVVPAIDPSSFSFEILQQIEPLGSFVDPFVAHLHHSSMSKTCSEWSSNGFGMIPQRLRWPQLRHLGQTVSAALCRPSGTASSTKVTCKEGPVMPWTPSRLVSMLPRRLLGVQPLRPKPHLIEKPLAQAHHISLCSWV